MATPVGPPRDRGVSGCGGRGNRGVDNRFAAVRTYVRVRRLLTGRGAWTRLVRSVTRGRGRRWPEWRRPLAVRDRQRVCETARFPFCRACVEGRAKARWESRVSIPSHWCCRVATAGGFVAKVRCNLSTGYWRLHSLPLSSDAYIHQGVVHQSRHNWLLILSEWLGGRTRNIMAKCAHSPSSRYPSST